MKHASTIVTLILAAVATAAFANEIPTRGTVYEGSSVPDVRLGASRLEVNNAYGKPTACVDVKERGDQLLCVWLLEGIGQVSVRYERAQGPVPGIHDDVVSELSFNGLPGWWTTAGMNTREADDWKTVARAYPEADLSFDRLGRVTSVVDYGAGIRFDYPPAWAIHRGVAIAVMSPSARIAPQVQPPIMVKKIRLEARENPQGCSHSVWPQGTSAGCPDIAASVRLVVEEGLPPQAVVGVRWELPDGTSVAVTGTSNMLGLARFRLSAPQTGTYRLVVEDVSLEGFAFDPKHSMMEAEIEVDW